MYTYFVINLESFKIKKNHPYTICFEATCPVFVHRTFNLEYTGTDLFCKEPLPSEYMDLICKEIQKIYGYGPFEKEKVDVLFKEHRQFRVNQGKEDD